MYVFFLYSVAQTRETGVLNAYFAAASVWALATDCHNQRIPSCPCTIDNIRQEAPNGDVIFNTCKADHSFAVEVFQRFAGNQINNATIEGQIDQHNIGFGEQVCVSLWVVFLIK